MATSNAALLWGFDLGGENVYPNTIPYGPAYANGRVASAPPNGTSSAAPLQVINATNGAYLSTAKYDAQFSSGSVPTMVDDEIYFASGYYGNVVFGANAASGNRMWRTEDRTQYGGYVMDGQSVAVDQRYVYFYRVGTLSVLDRSGTPLKSIQNPFFTKSFLSYSGSYVGGPMLDGMGRIFVFTDNYDPSKSLPIAAFGLNEDKPLWRSSYSYTGQPALRGGIIYAARSASTIIDMIDTATGAVSKSIDVGGSDNLTSNVVVSDSHLFVASANTTFAIDLGNSNFPVVWKTSYGGNLALTPDGYIIISTKTGLHAAKLK
ncbi:PQQ-binding-like beta-propeller repeat protein [Sphingomonas sanguinis]|nr:PQQ-binding-like beta-propeller repeat protein [Sphingomonas sanguinis]